MTSPPDTIPAPLHAVAELPIHAGDAQHAMLAALANLTAAAVAVERIAMAMARALDEAAKPKEPTP